VTVILLIVGHVLGFPGLLVTLGHYHQRAAGCADETKRAPGLPAGWPTGRC